jgi:hypothetical protein
MDDIRGFVDLGGSDDLGSVDFLGSKCLDSDRDDDVRHE